MKTNPEFILRQVAGENMLVPCGEAAKKYNGLINMNDTAAFIWKQIDTAADMQEIVEALKEHYDVDAETAAMDVPGLIREYAILGMVELEESEMEPIREFEKKFAERMKKEGPSA